MSVFTRQSGGDPPVAAALAVAVGLLVLAAVGLVAVPVTGWLAGDPAGLPRPGEVVGGLLSAAGLPHQPSPTAGLLGAHPGLYALVAAVILGLLGAAAAPTVVWWWRRWGPTPNGHATRPQIHAELSVVAARRSGERTRPALTPGEVRAAAPAELGIPLHYYVRMPLWAPWTNLTGTLAPTQTGKSRKDLVHKVLDAPGALLCTTTKPDLAEFSALAMARRPMAGPVIVHDATGRLRWPGELRWSPIHGCTDQQEAARRAYTLVEAAAVRVEAGAPGSAGNDAVFRERAVGVLTAYLVAAAAAGRGVDALVAWSMNPPPASDQPHDVPAADRARGAPPRKPARYPLDPEPIELLITHGRHELAAALSAEMRMDPRTVSAVWLSVRRVTKAWTDPRIRELCTPTRDGGLDVRRHIAAGGALFLIADQQQAAEAVPVLTALAEYWLRTAQDLALDHPARRLDPPATAVLDELANGIPIPRLAEVVSDAAGRGVVIHWAAQSLAQLDRIFGHVGCREVLDNTTSLSAWGGIKDDRTLRWLSELCGTREIVRRQSHTDGALFGPARSSTSLNNEPVLRPGEIRNLPQGTVLLLHRSMRAILATARDVSRRPEAAQLAADVETVRSGRIPIDDHGYLAGKRPEPAAPPATPPRPVRVRPPAQRASGR